MYYAKIPIVIEDKLGFNMNYYYAQHVPDTLIVSDLIFYFIFYFVLIDFARKKTYQKLRLGWTQETSF